MDSRFWLVVAGVVGGLLWGYTSATASRDRNWLSAWNRRERLYTRLEQEARDRQFSTLQHVSRN